MCLNPTGLHGLDHGLPVIPAGRLVCARGRAVLIGSESLLRIRTRNRSRTASVSIARKSEGSRWQNAGPCLRRHGRKVEVTPLATRLEVLTFEYRNKIRKNKISKVRYAPSLGKHDSCFVEHISMQVTKQRTTVEYDCAHGTIDQAITLDRRGRFDVSGIQVAEHGGPVRQNEQLAGYRVRFAGQVNGKRMMLRVTNSVTKELVGDFTLIYGDEPKLRKCK